MFRIVHFVLYRRYKYMKSKLGHGGPRRTQLLCTSNIEVLSVQYTTFNSHVIHMLLNMSQYGYLVCISIYVFFLNIVYVLINIWHISQLSNLADMYHRKRETHSNVFKFKHSFSDYQTDKTFVCFVYLSVYLKKKKKKKKKNSRYKAYSMQKLKHVNFVPFQLQK